MKPEDVIVLVAIVAIVGLAVGYVVRAKRRGKKCIGCPHSNTCPSAKNGKCNCK